MNKAEELKQKAKIPEGSIVAVATILSNDETELKLKKDKKYCFSKCELDEYATEVSREVAEKAEEFLRDKKTSLFLGLKVYTFKEVCELLDEYAKQGERKGFDEGFNKARIKYEMIERYSKADSEPKNLPPEQ